MNIQKENDTKKDKLNGEVNKTKLNLYFIVICLQTMAIYCAICVNTYVIDDYLAELDESTYELAVSLSSYSTLIGGFLGGILGNFGRRKVMIGSALFACCLFGITSTMSSIPIMIFYIFLQGLMRFILANSLLFIKEIIPFFSTSNIVWFMFYMNIGSFVGTVIKYIVFPEEKNPEDYLIQGTIVGIVLGVIPCLIQAFFLLFVFTYESPLYLIEKGKLDEAEKAIGIFCSKDQVVKYRDNAILKSKRRKGFSVTWLKMLSLAYIPATVVGCLLMFTKNFLNRILDKAINTGLANFNNKTVEAYDIVISAVFWLGPLICVFLLKKKIDPKLFIVIGSILELITIGILWCLIHPLLSGNPSIIYAFAFFNILKYAIRYTTVGPLTFVYAMKSLPDKGISFAFSCFWFADKMRYKVFDAYNEYPVCMSGLLMYNSITVLIELLILIFFVGIDSRYRWSLCMEEK